VRRSVGQSGPSLSSRELGAAMSMARFWRDQGRRDEAREFSLRSTAGSPRVSIRWILKEARALLDELAT
jgi:hypothetical protein